MVPSLILPGFFGFFGLSHFFPPLHFLLSTQSPFLKTNVQVIGSATVSPSKKENGGKRSTPVLEHNGLN
jgi:hypothetical protein